MKTWFKDIKMSENIAEGYTVVIYVTADTVSATFELPVPYIRPHYKKWMDRVSDIQEEAKGELKAFLKELQVELEPKPSAPPGGGEEFSEPEPADQEA
jgi:hypothetical protein